MNRVTDFRVDTVEIPIQKFYQLPARTQELIRAYAEELPSKQDGVLRFELAVYRWAEIQESMGGALENE